MERRKSTREKSIKEAGNNNSIKKSTDGARYIKLELVPIDANGFEVSARQKILQYLQDGETFYFGRSKSLGITDTRISRNQLMIVANIPGGVSVKNTGMNYSRYARKQNRDKTRILSKEEPVHLKNGDEIELFSGIERFRLSIDIVNEIPAQALAKEAGAKEKRNRSASSNGNLSKSNSNINNNSISSDTNVNNNQFALPALRDKSTGGSALISPKRLNESDTKEKKPKRDHRHSLHEHRSMSPKVKKEDRANNKKEKVIPEDSVRQIQEILPGVPRFKVLTALRAYSGDIERATNYLLTKPHEQILDEPMDSSPVREDMGPSPLASPKESQVIVLDDEDEDGKAEEAREEMEIDLYFSADGGKGKSDSDDEDSVHEEHDILPTDPTVTQSEKIDVDLEDEKALAGRYDSFLNSHSVPDEMYIHQQVTPQPVDMATQNISELFTQLQAANAKVSELEKQVKTLTGGFGFEVFMKMKKAHAEAMKKKEKSECMICYEKKKKITTACGCKVMCKSCYNKIPKKICPNCNKPILYYNASS
eukprot:TRINITY_DN1728_c0_g1_i1.p1 TRINITY_DN1728_c0_g1~~TRINITY_DN1728_c0_g1_i1.p1  ORF type:complete len:537 (-),score=94.54 TRINITY_DN1728_c0_g1_i1:47-1657(-)